MYTNLSHVCVTAILMIRYDCDLNHKCSDWTITDIFDWYLYPTCWLKVMQTLTKLLKLQNPSACFAVYLLVPSNQQFQFLADHWNACPNVSIFDLVYNFRPIYNRCICKSGWQMFCVEIECSPSAAVGHPIANMYPYNCHAIAQRQILWNEQNQNVCKAFLWTILPKSRNYLVYMMTNSIQPVHQLQLRFPYTLRWLDLYHRPILYSCLLMVLFNILKLRKSIAIILFPLSAFSLLCHTNTCMHHQMTVRRTLTCKQTKLRLNWKRTTHFVLSSMRWR